MYFTSSLRDAFDEVKYTDEIFWNWIFIVNRFIVKFASYLIFHNLMKGKKIKNIILKIYFPGEQGRKLKLVKLNFSSKRCRRNYKVKKRRRNYFFMKVIQKITHFHKYLTYQIVLVLWSDSFSFFRSVSNTSVSFVVSSKISIFLVFFSFLAFFSWHAIIICLFFVMFRVILCTYTYNDQI